MCVSPDTAPDLSESSPGTDPEMLCPEIPWRIGGGLEQIQLAKHRGTYRGLAGTGGCTRRIPVVFWQCWNQQLLPEAHQVRERKGCMFHIPGSSSPHFPGHQDSLHSHLHFTLASGSFLVPALNTPSCSLSNGEGLTAVRGHDRESQDPSLIWEIFLELLQWKAFCSKAGARKRNP